MRKMFFIKNSLKFGLLGVLAAGFFLVSQTFAIELNSQNIVGSGFNCFITNEECYLSNKGITSIASGTFKNHTGLNVLYLGGNQIASIESGDFVGLSNLSNLYLGGNQITSIESGDFFGLTKLDLLEITNNQIASLESDDFMFVATLRYLHLDGNHISFIGDGFLPSQLSTLTLDNNNISSLSNSFFDELPRLSSFSINNNQLTTIPSSIGNLQWASSLSFRGNKISTLPTNLSNLLYLSQLDLAENQLSSLSSSTFSGLPSLSTLYLSDNKITSLSSGLFDSLSSLSELYLSNNLITDLSVGMFSACSQLQYIGLSSNRISTIRSGTFLGLSNLGYLSLDNNQISDLALGVFGGINPALSQLELYGNQLTGLISGIFDDIPNVSWINLGGNQFQTIPNVFSGLQSLFGVSFGGNQIYTIDLSPLVGLPSLSSLDLAYNQIESLPTNIFLGFPNVYSIQLQGNKITHIESGSFNGLSGLSNLYFGENPITTIEKGSFVGLSNLFLLDLQLGEISVIEPGAFSGLSNLSMLYLGQNQITSLEAGAFSGLSNLSTLYLEQNQITSLEAGAFSGLSNLSTLYLGQNQITSLELGAFSALSSVQEISLGNNQIMSLEPGTFDGLTMLRNLYLNDNYITSLDLGTFDGLSSLSYLNFDRNHIVFIDTGMFTGLPNVSLSFNENPIDDSFCGIISSADVANFISVLLNKSYTTGGGILGLSDSYYVGSGTLSFAPGITNTIFANTVMQSSLKYTQSYYQHPVEVEYGANTQITTSGSNFTGVLQAPILLSTGVVKNLNKVISVTKFGDSTKSIQFSQPVTVRMPALGKNIGDIVKIYYTHDVKSSWTFHTTASVLDIGGVPYVEFTTNHATYFAIGEENGGGTGSFVINNDDFTTNSLNVDLAMSFPSGNPQYMRFSNDAANRSTRESYLSSKSRTLLSGAGLKTVYAQFDMNGDFSGDNQTSDTITYEVPLSGSTQGQIQFMILTGSSYCVYGNTFDLGTKGVSNGVTTFSGNFNTASGNNTRSCANYNGISTQANLTIQMSGDLVNQKNISTIIGSGNVRITYGTTIFGGGFTGVVRSGTNLPLNTQQILFGTTSTVDLRVGTISTNGVQLQVTTNPNQAPGTYQGTLIITLPW